jgi:hypothetical protein
MEIWKPAPGIAGYEASDTGRVRSIDREIVLSTGRRYFQRGRVLKAGLASSGYLTVMPGRAHGSKCVHSLVLLSFVGPCPAGQEGLHWDDVKLNNKLSNLRYGTRSQNMLDSVRNGGWYSPGRVANITVLPYLGGAARWL